MSTSNVESGGNHFDENDSDSKESKLETLKIRNLAKSAWYDVKCGVCNKHCCSPCTAGGDISRCAVTRFTECSVCGHPSNQHYGVPH